MAEYIEREAVVRFIENGLNNPDKQEAFGHDAIEIMAEVHYMPAADVAPVVHGRWEIKTDDYDCEYAKCSVCGEEYYDANEDTIDITFNYCPYCGARMDGE